MGLVYQPGGSLVTLSCSTYQHFISKKVNVYSFQYHWLDIVSYSFFYGFLLNMLTLKTWVYFYRKYIHGGVLFFLFIYYYVLLFLRRPGHQLATRSLWPNQYPFGWGGFVHVKNIFQSIESTFQASLEKKIEKKKIKTWPNCPPRPDLVMVAPACTHTYKVQVGSKTGLDHARGCLTLDMLYF